MEKTNGILFKKRLDISLSYNKYTIFKDAKDIYEGYKRCNRTSKR